MEMDGHRRRDWTCVNNLHVTPIREESVDVLLRWAQTLNLQNEGMTDVKLKTVRIEAHIHLSAALNNT